jgi:hypothetical protein
MMHWRARAVAATLCHGPLQLADTAIPVVMAVPALLPVVCNLEANAIGALEERRRVVICVLRISPCLRGVNSERAKLLRHDMNIFLGIDTQTKVMKTR